MSSYRISAFGPSGAWQFTISARTVRQACIAARADAPPDTELLTVNGIQIPVK